jgi:hypothetical protein
MKTGSDRFSRQLKMRPASRNQRNRSTNVALDRRADTALQRRLMHGIDNSLPIQRQRDQIKTAFGQPLQRVAEEEELLQGKFKTLQRQGPEEEELLQGKFDVLQRQPEEEELLQGKFETLQRQGLEEEELLQGKFDTVQRQSDEEELLQGKFEQPLQRQQEAQNKTGLPDNLKHGIEALGGVDMSAVRVHYNSSKPAQLNAHAFAQGNDIHLGSGQEKHLPHEAWHTVQQSLGRVAPTMRMGGEQINDDQGLEREADLMGEKALQYKK